MGTLRLPHYFLELNKRKNFTLFGTNSEFCEKNCARDVKDTWRCLYHLFVQGVSGVNPDAIMGHSLGDYNLYLFLVGDF